MIIPQGVKMSYNQDVDNQAGGYRPDKDAVQQGGEQNNCSANAGSAAAPEAQALKACQNAGFSCWMNIGTVPKDGTRILLGRMENGEIINIADDFWYQDRIQGGFDTYSEAFDDPPTHWTHIYRPYILPSDPALTEALAVIEKQREALGDARRLIEPLAKNQLGIWNDGKYQAWNDGEYFARVAFQKLGGKLS